MEVRVLLLLLLVGHDFRVVELLEELHGLGDCHVDPGVRRRPFVPAGVDVLPGGPGGDLRVSAVPGEIHRAPPVLAHFGFSVLRKSIRTSSTRITYYCILRRTNEMQPKVTHVFVGVCKVSIPLRYSSLFLPGGREIGWEWEPKIR